MIGLLTGIVKYPKQNPLIVDVHGVGYVVRVSQTLSTHIQPDKPCTLFIHTHVRDDAIDLFGFKEQQELRLFELLLTVSGVGPKTALSVVDRGVSQVERAVRAGDVDFFTTIPRLGKKNAQKIIIELKHIFGSIGELDLRGDSDGETKELIDALTSMGFGRNEVLEAVKKIGGENQTLEQKIRLALKFLGKQR